MPAGTRASARRAANPSSSSPSQNNEVDVNGRKRKADASPAQAKKGRKSSEPKKQKTIEQTMPDLETDGKDEKDDKEVLDEDVNDKEMADVAEEVEGKQDAKDGIVGNGKAVEPAASATNGMKDEAKDEEPSNEAKEEGEGEPVEADAAEDTSAENSTTQDEKPPQQSSEDKKEDSTAKPASDDKPAKTDEPAEPQPSTSDNNKPSAADDTTSTMDSTGKISQQADSKAEADAQTSTTGAISTSTSRKEAMPSNILEKGIIYFLTRARVGVEDAQSVQDIARSYIVLRPLPNGAKIGQGTLEDTNNNRLLALPKKVLPKSGRDQFLVFVEKSGTSMKELKEDFMKGSDYETKTTGVRHTPAVTPIGEGVYAITTTGRESHLAYMITIPAQMGEVQEDMGLQQQGSFVLSTKNPSAPSPANASLPRGPEFPKEIMDEFHGLRWMGSQPKHLNYENAQVLFIGEGQGKEGFGNALDAEPKDEKHEEKETPREEIEKLEEEDHKRVEGLQGDEKEAVFKDLKLSREEYPELMTTW